jgi:hypothetical protein
MKPERLQEIKSLATSNPYALTKMEIRQTILALQFAVTELLEERARFENFLDDQIVDVFLKHQLMKALGKCPSMK